MAINLGDLITMVRAIIVDREDVAVTPAFTDEEITSSVNAMMGGFFGLRPEAFSVDAIVTTPPADLSADGDEVPVNAWAVNQFACGVAAFLLLQRGKDAYYRKAADDLNKIYMGR